MKKEIKRKGCEVDRDRMERKELKITLRFLTWEVASSGSTGGRLGFAMCVGSSGQAN